MLTGEQGSRLAIPAGDVACIRIAGFPVRYGPTLYETRIWRTGKGRPLLIVPMPHQLANYGPAMREFAGWVHAVGGDVLRGPGLLALVVQTAFTVGSVALIALLLLGGAIVEGKWWMWVITLFAAGLAVLLFFGLYRTSWPRRVTSPDELDEMLPLREESRA